MCYTQHLSQNSYGFSCHDRNVTTKCLLPDFFKKLPFSFGVSEILITFAEDLCNPSHEQKLTKK